MIWPFKRREVRNAETTEYPYTDQKEREGMSYVAVARAAGESAAIECVSALLGRSLAEADIRGEGWTGRTITRSWRNLAGRALIRDGYLLAVPEVMGEDVAMIPATLNYWTDRGGMAESAWTAHCTINTPSRVVTRTLPRGSVVYLPWGVSPKDPDRPKPPTSWAATAARLDGNAETVLADEMGGPVSQLIAVPKDGADDSWSEVTEQLGRARGGVALVESTRSAPNVEGQGFARHNAPQRDWVASRLGPNPPGELVELARDSFARVVSACGAPPSLFEARADGTSQREALRRWHMATVRPIAALLSEELTLRLDTPVAFHFDAYATDLQGRATAFKQLVAQGMEIDKALSITGLLVGGEG